MAGGNGRGGSCPEVSGAGPVAGTEVSGAGPAAGTEVSGAGPAAGTEVSGAGPAAGTERALRELNGDGRHVWGSRRPSL